MQIWTTLKASDLEVYAAELGIRAEVSDLGTMRSGKFAGKRKLSARLFPQRGSDTYRKRNPRRINAVCWHGHRDWMRAIYRADADARIKTAIADYVGSDGFERTFPATGRQNIGSMMVPLEHASACECGPEVQTGTLEANGSVTNVRMIRQSDILACPHVIMVPGHYRADGTCRCDDPQSEEMRQAGYEWKDGAWQ